MAFWFMLAWVVQASSIYERFSVGERPLPDSIQHSSDAFRWDADSGRAINHYLQLKQDYGWYWAIPQVPDMNRRVMTPILWNGLCPNGYLLEKASYIRFLYRMASLSIVIEHNDAMIQLASRYGVRGCTPTAEMFDNCKARSSWMKTFSRSFLKMKRHFDRYQPKVPGYSLKVLAQWGEAFPGHPVSVDLDGNYTQDAFRSRCQNNVELVQKLCSEVDEFHGLSGVDEIYQNLKESHVTGQINKYADPAGCLFRYREMNRVKSFVPKRVQAMVAAWVPQFQREWNGRFPLGRAFIPGSLQYYEKAGLKGLVEENKVAAKKTVKKKTAKAPTSRPAKKLKKVKSEGEKKVAKKAPQPVVPPPKPKREFHKAIERLLALGMPFIQVNVDAIRKEFAFSSANVKRLQKLALGFFARDKLKVMKVEDGLGKRSAPIPLSLLAFMIGRKLHQQLFNLKLGISQDFYVIDDVDSENPHGPQLVGIRFHQQEWLLILFDQDKNPQS